MTHTNLNCILDAFDLHRNDGKNFNGNAIEFIETTPGSCLRQAFVNVAARTIVHLFGTVEYVDHDTQSFTKILDTFGLTGAG